MTDPFDDVADARAVEELLRTVESLVLERIVERSEADPKGQGLEEALFLRVGTPDDPTPVEVEIGGRASRTRLYACRSGSRAVCGTVDAAVALALLKEPESLRESRS